MYSYFWVQLVPLNTMVSSAVRFLQTAWFHSSLWLKNSIVCMAHIPFVWWTPSLAAFLGEQFSHIVSSAMETWMYKDLCGALAQHPSGKFPREFFRVIWQFWCQGFDWGTSAGFLFWLHKFTFPSALNKSSFSFNWSEKESQSVLICFYPMDRNIEFFSKLFIDHFRFLFCKLSPILLAGLFYFSV